MKHQRLSYALVGVFVLAMLAAGLGGALVLAGRTGTSDSYSVLFDNIADVKFGTQVRFEGFPVGQVEEIRPVEADGMTRFELEISVREGWAIPADSVARIGSSTFLGAKTVDIQRGRDAVRLKPGAMIASAAPADMFAAMSNVAGQFGDLSRDELQPLMARLTEMVTTADSLMQNDVTAFLASLNGVAAELQSSVPALSADLLVFTDRLNATMASLQSVVSEDNVQGVDRVLENVEQVTQELVAISVNVQGTLGQVNAIMLDLERVVEANEGKLGSAMEDTRYTLHTIAQSIDAISHNLAGSARNMNEFSRLIRQNPGLLLDGSPREEVRVEASQTQPEDNLQ